MGGIRRPASVRPPEVAGAARVWSRPQALENLARFANERADILGPVRSRQPLRVLEEDDGELERHLDLAEDVRGGGETGCSGLAIPLQRRTAGAEACADRAERGGRVAPWKALDEGEKLVHLRVVTQYESCIQAPGETTRELSQPSHELGSHRDGLVRRSERLPGVSFAEEHFSFDRLECHEVHAARGCRLRFWRPPGDAWPPRARPCARR